MKRLLFLCTEGFDTAGPSNHLICSLIDDLLKSNFKITLIQSRRNKKRDDLPKELKDRVDLKVVNVNRKIIAKNNFILRYLEETIYAFRCFKVWKGMKDIDAVFVQSCPTVVFSILLLKLFLRKPILYNIQDMWPGSAVNSGVLKNKFIIRVFYLLQKLAYKYSDVLTVLSEDMKEKVIEQNVSEKKIFKIPNWFDDQSIHEIEWKKNRFVKKYSVSNQKFYVQYAGTIGYVFDYEMVLNVAEQLKNYDDIVFQMIGRGSQKKRFIDEKEKRGLKNIVFYPLQPQQMVSDVYSSCSIGFIPLKKGIIGNSVPSKIALLMACNRVIVNSVDEDSKYFKMFNEKKIGIAVSNKHPSEVANAILKLYKNKTKRNKIAKNAMLFVQKYYARNINSQKYIKLFKWMMMDERNEK